MCHLPFPANYEKAGAGGRFFAVIGDGPGQVPPQGGGNLGRFKNLQNSRKKRLTHRAVASITPLIERGGRRFWRQPVSLTGSGFWTSNGSFEWLPLFLVGMLQPDLAGMLDLGTKGFRPVFDMVG
jgi:hypothetical protein